MDGSGVGEREDKGKKAGYSQDNGKPSGYHQQLLKSNGKQGDQVWTADSTDVTEMQQSPQEPVSFLSSRQVTFIRRRYDSSSTVQLYFQNTFINVI
ncbi:hypothetical protein E5288_WYG002846 [Bos mutus]|uniref:Uncharacterized protein n=1 Tax=Bos mutus TaxID=72004 RepID=A0A6B0RY90_9CETA|nr:hypothetical protein [Bos mutus]